MEMGVVPGADVRVVKAAPFGDPIEVVVRGYNLAMRCSEAESVEVVPV
jgi:Fe2+ transport system protein FeoA